MTPIPLILACTGPTGSLSGMQMGERDPLTDTAGDTATPTDDTSTPPKGEDGPALSLAGCVVDSAYDYGLDGAIEIAQVSTYNEAGLLSTLETDSFGDGTVDATQAHFYDDDERLVRSEYDGDADGVVDEVHRWESAKKKGIFNEYVDLDGDGKDDSLVVHTEDDDGWPLSAVTDEGIDGTIERRITWTYSQDGADLDVKEETDEDDDGFIDAVSIEIYDDDLLVSENLDGDNDGLDDRIWTWSHDAWGKLQHELSERFDKGEFLDVTATDWVWDGGYEERLDIDVHEDGEVDATLSHAYACP